MSHSTVSWDVLGLPSQFKAGMGRPLLGMQMSWPSRAGPSSPDASLPFQFSSSPRKHRKETVLGARGAEGGARLAPLMVGFPGVEEPESLAETSAARQRTSGWPLGSQALLGVQARLAAWLEILLCFQLPSSWRAGASICSPGGPKGQDWSRLCVLSV